MASRREEAIPNTNRPMTRSHAATSRSNNHLSNSVHNDENHETKGNIENDLLERARIAMELTRAVLKHGPGNRDFRDKKGKKRGIEITQHNNNINTTIDGFFKGEFTNDNIAVRANLTIQAGTGNCDQHAFVTFCYLVMKGVQNVYISQEGAHTFVTIGQMQEGGNIIVCDAWADNCFAVKLGQVTKTQSNDYETSVTDPSDSNTVYTFTTTDVHNTGNGFTFDLGKWTEYYQSYTNKNKDKFKKLIEKIAKYKAKILAAEEQGTKYKSSNNQPAIKNWYGLERRFSKESQLIFEAMMEEVDQLEEEEDIED